MKMKGKLFMSKQVTKAISKVKVKVRYVTEKGKTCHLGPVPPDITIKFYACIKLSFPFKKLVAQGIVRRPHGFNLTQKLRIREIERESSH